MGEAKYKRYLQTELESLIRSEYDIEVPNKTEDHEVQKQNLHKLISRSLNHLEVSSNEITRYLIRHFMGTEHSELMTLMRVQSG